MTAMDPAEGGRWSRLCRLEDIPDGGSAGFTIEGDDEAAPVMIIRRGTVVRAYINACPHIGLSLDMVPGRFLNRERTHILCANHGALFDIDSGTCVQGPCRGDHLAPVRCDSRDGVIFVSLER